MANARNVTVTCSKEVTCAACGTVFLHLLRREVPIVTASGPPAALEAAMEKNEGRLDEQVPCPSCGLYQPEMVAARRAGRHGQWTLIALPVPAFVLVILVGSRTIGEHVAVWVAVGLALVTMVGHMVIDMANPNRDPDANRRRAAVLTATGALRRLAPEDPSRAEPDAGRSAGRPVVPFLFLLAAVGLAAPEFLRLANGWDASDACRPAVVGPGDEIKVEFPNRVSSVQGLWMGREVSASILNARELGLPDGRAKASSHPGFWGAELRVKKSEKSQTVRPWVKVVMPPADALADREVRLGMNLIVGYPEMAGPNGFENRTTALAHEIRLRLGSDRAGKTYMTAWWAAMVGGAVALTLLSLLARPAVAPAGLASPADADPPVGSPPRPAAGAARSIKYQPHDCADGRAIKTINSMTRLDRTLMRAIVRLHLLSSFNPGVPAAGRALPCQPATSRSRRSPSTPSPAAPGSPAGCSPPARAASPRPSSPTRTASRTPAWRRRGTSRTSPGAALRRRRSSWRTSSPCPSRR